VPNQKKPMICAAKVATTIPQSCGAPIALTAAERAETGDISVFKRISDGVQEFWDSLPCRVLCRVFLFFTCFTQPIFTQLWVALRFHHSDVMAKSPPLCSRWPPPPACPAGFEVLHASRRSMGRVSVGNGRCVRSGAMGSLPERG